MIIQVRGTSGSGKSTVIRQFMGGRTWKPIMAERRHKPLYYLSDKVAVLGHYESECGGCDTINGHEFLYGLQLTLHNQGYQVVAEGLLLSEDVKWSSRLPKLKVLFLITSLEECLQRVRQRRKRKGNNKPLNPKNTTNRIGVILRARKRLEAAGIPCRSVGQNQAVKVLNRWMKGTSHG